MPFNRRKTGSRSPVEGSLRRLPGQSVRDERDKLLNDTASDYLLLIVIVWFLAGWEWFRRWNPSPIAPEILTAIALLVTAYCAFRIFRLRREIRNLNRAERGERRVSELLTQLRRKRYVTFDDLLVDRSNIDHVLVGPGGIFAIETKAYSIFGNGCVGVDESGVLRLSNKRALKNPLRQAAASAADAERFRCDSGFDFSGLDLEGRKSRNWRGRSE